MSLIAKISRGRPHKSLDIMCRAWKLGKQALQGHTLAVQLVANKRQVR